MPISNLLLAALAGSASAVRLFATNWGATGELATISTLEFDEGSASLTAQQTNQECGGTATWLDDSQRSQNLLYCVDEGWNTNTAGNGSINTLEIVSDGSLKRVNTIETVAGPVAIQFYNEDKAVAMANYGGNASTTYTVSDDKKTFTHVQTESFFAVNGPRPDQKKSLHHQAVLDPTKKYMLFPDVGADAIRVYQIDPSNSVLTALPSIQAPAAYGPRHATFWTPTTAGHGQKPCTYLFVIHELINRVTSYKVDDSTTPVTFQETEASKKDGGFLLFDGDATWARPAEIAVSPDNRFITASNRNVTNMEVNGVVGDSLTVFKPCADGSLERVGVYPSGGAFPRHFSYSKDGGHIAVANTNTNSVAIFKRNIESGEIGDLVANGTLPGAATFVMWDEQ